MTLRLPAGRPGVWRGEARLELSNGAAATPFVVVRPGTAGPVAVARGEAAGQEVWTIANGAWRWTVAPGFGPSVIAWEPEQEPASGEAENLLWSLFPNAARLVGITPGSAACTPGSTGGALGRESVTCTASRQWPRP